MPAHDKAKYKKFMQHSLEKTNTASKYFGTQLFNWTDLWKFQIFATSWTYFLEIQRNYYFEVPTYHFQGHFFCDLVKLSSTFFYLEGIPRVRRWCGNHIRSVKRNLYLTPNLIFADLDRGTQIHEICIIDHDAVFLSF